MTTIYRFSGAAALVIGVAGVAHAQSHPRHWQAAPDSYYALSQGRSNVVIDRSIDTLGVVPPSESQTVMGLRVPR